MHGLENVKIGESCGYSCTV